MGVSGALRAAADNSDIYDKTVEEILRRDLDIPGDKWSVLQTRDLVVPAQEALAFKIAHQISDFTPKIGELYNI